MCISLVGELRRIWEDRRFLVFLVGSLLGSSFVFRFFISFFGEGKGIMIGVGFLVEFC